MQVVVITPQIKEVEVVQVPEDGEHLMEQVQVVILQVPLL